METKTGHFRYPRVDSHQHFWSVERTDYGWLLPNNTVLFRDFLPEQLKPLLEAAGFHLSMAVQAAPTVAETDYLLSLSDRYPFVAGVVGWLDLTSDTFAKDYARLREHPRFIGFRPMIQDLPDEWLLQPTVLRNLETVVADDFPLDLQANLRHLDAITELLRIFPGMRAVVDHFAKPAIRSLTLDPWREQMSKIASHPGLYCKLSGLLIETKAERWTTDLPPYVQHVVRSFGAERVMWGSDWPVCLTGSNYADTYDVLRAALPDERTEEQETMIFGGTACRFYKLRLPEPDTDC